MHGLTKRFLALACAVAGMATVTTINGCAESKKVAGKTGVQLWAENCQRCHNTPSPTAFNAEQWQTVGMHMQTRAMLTNNERDKIVDFLRSSAR